MSDYLPRCLWMHTSSAAVTR